MKERKQFIAQPLETSIANLREPDELQQGSWEGSADQSTRIGHLVS